MKLSDLFFGTEIALSPAISDREITGIRSDSRKVEKGDLFVCLPGLHTDGHEYIKEALARGAVAVLGSKKVDTGKVPMILCEDPRRAEAFACYNFYGRPGEKMKIIGVTGTNGKTSVSFMLYAILKAAGHSCGLLGTVTCCLDGKEINTDSGDPLANMTTPDPSFLYRVLGEMQKGGAEYVIMEVSSHALALEKVAPLVFEAGIFTNLSPEHLDFHGDMESYFKAKAKLFGSCRRAVINIDTKWGRTLASQSVCPAVTAGTDGGDYAAREIEQTGTEGVGYHLCAPRGRYTVKCRIPGAFTVDNTLCALACALELGIAPGIALTAVATMSGVPGRMERVRLGAVTGYTVFIDYAHTPDALEKLLETFADMKAPGQRIILLFGCGGDRDREKRPVMGQIAERYADRVILTADNSRSEDVFDILRDIYRGMEGESCVIIPDRRRAIEYALENARDGDVILLAGKGHETYEMDQTGRKYFSEKQIVRSTVATLAVARAEPRNR